MRLLPKDKKEVFSRNSTNKGIYYAMNLFLKQYEDRVVLFLLNISTTASSNQSTAEALNHLLTKLDDANENILVAKEVA